MSIHTLAEAGGSVTITVRGNVEHHNAADIHHAVQEAVTRYRPPHLCLDLSLVTFMATEATKHLITSHTTARSSGTRLVVRNPSAPVRRILDLYAVPIPLA